MLKYKTSKVLRPELASYEWCMAMVHPPRPTLGKMLASTMDSLSVQNTAFREPLRTATWVFALLNLLKLAENREGTA